MKKIHLSLVSCAAIGATIVTSGCGSSSSSGTATLGSTLTNLSQLPSVSSMITTSSSSLSSTAVDDALSGRIATSAAVTGTPPLISALTTSSAVDTYFWNGLVAAINTAGTATADQAAQFFGTVAGGPAGEGGCMMAQSVGENIGRMLQSGTSACYMRRIPTASSGVTVTGSTSSDMMTQGAADKVLQIGVTGMSEERGGGGSGMTVNIRISGTDSVGSDVYRAKLWFCDAGSVSGEETIEVNRTSGTYTVTEVGSESRGGGSGVHRSSVSANLRVSSSGAIEFDPTRDRTASFSYNHSSYGTFKGEIRITSADRIYAKRYYSGTYGGTTNLDKNYSIAGFSGTSFSTLRFREGAYKGLSSWGSYSAHSYNGATEFQDTFYKAVSSSDLKTEVDAFDFTTDSFFTTTSVTAFTAVESCSGFTPNATVTVNFSDAGVLAVAAACESDRFDSYSMCWGSEIQSAMSRVFARF